MDCRTPFSKVGSLLNSLYKLTIKPTFQNFSRNQQQSIDCRPPWGTTFRNTFSKVSSLLNRIQKWLCCSFLRNSKKSSCNLILRSRLLLTAMSTLSWKTCSEARLLPNWVFQNDDAADFFWDFGRVFTFENSCSHTGLPLIHMRSSDGCGCKPARMCVCVCVGIMICICE